MNAYEAIPAFLAGVGVIQSLAGATLAVRFLGRAAHDPTAQPPVTVLKPLHGDEPLLEDALASLCIQDYPTWQVVFGVQSPADPAIAVVARIQARWPGRDIALVVDPTQHGSNRKVGNLINMLPAARHDLLVIADSDVHVRPDYLRRLVACLEQPNVGLATTLYAGLPVGSGLAARLGASQITHGFLPGAVLSRVLGRQDCLGATMCLRRDTLSSIGGFLALVPHLADDNMLGTRVRALGLGVGLADTVPLTTVPEADLAALFRHELRWARTIRALVPVAFVASALQYPLFWALLLLLSAGFAPWALGFAGIVWVLRAVAALAIDRALLPRTGSLAFGCPVWLLPLRDALSVAVMLASFGGRRVEWRGHRMTADTPPQDTRTGPVGPAEGLRSR